jgi:hypothetical protein
LLNRPDFLKRSSGHSARFRIRESADHAADGDLAEEIERARELIDAAKAELEREGRAFDREIPVGIMIETPRPF